MKPVYKAYLKYKIQMHINILLNMYIL